MTDSPYGGHQEAIECPSCHLKQMAFVEHTPFFNTYIHNCPCGYTIMESEWQQCNASEVKDIIVTPKE